MNNLPAKRTTQQITRQITRQTRLLEKTDLTLGFIPLTDCAPLVIALEKGFFARSGLNITLSRESSWANIRDKVSYGLLDGAHMLAAMPLASTIGLGTPEVPMLTAFSMDLNGNAITVSNALYERMLAADAQALDNPKTTAHALKQVIEQDRAAGRPALSFAMVFPMSSHHYALRYWMAAAGIDPDNDVRLTVIPPPQMVNYLQAGLIDGYCVGEPWNSLAVRSAIGRVLITSYDIWNNHPEKVFAVHRDWAEHYPNTHHALLMALLESAQWLDQPHNRLEAADILAYGRYVNVPSEILQMSMTGTFQYATDQAPVAMPDFNVFYRYAATCPWRSHALWFLTQMIRCGQLDRTVDIRSVAATVYRPDIYRDAAAALGLPYPGGDEKIEGIHPEPWQLERNISEPINMGADMFFDGKVFDSAALSDPVEHFAPESEEISESS